MTAVPTSAAGDREGLVQAVEVKIARVLHDGVPGVECSHARDRKPSCERDAFHIARALLAPDGPVGAALAEAWEQGADAQAEASYNGAAEALNPYRAETGS